MVLSVAACATLDAQKIPAARIAAASPWTYRIASSRTTARCNLHGRPLAINRRRVALFRQYGRALRESAGGGDELARHHHHRHRVLLGADLGEHLHAAQFERGGGAHDLVRGLAQLDRGLEL